MPGDRGLRPASRRLLLVTGCFLPPKSHFLTRSHHTHTHTHTHTHLHPLQPAAFCLPNLTFLRVHTPASTPPRSTTALPMLATRGIPCPHITASTMHRRSSSFRPCLEMVHRLGNRCSFRARRMVAVFLCCLTSSGFAFRQARTASRPRCGSVYAIYRAFRRCHPNCSLGSNPVDSLSTVSPSHINTCRC